MQRLLALVVAAILPACAAETLVRPADAGRTAQEAAIKATLARQEQVAQINMQRLPLEVALQFLAHHLGVPMAIQWDELESRGIHRDEATTTLNLFDASYADALRAALWLLRPARGQIDCDVTYGGLIIGAASDEPPPVETTEQIAADAHIAALLAEPVEVSANTSDTAENLFYALSFANKISLIVDWDELARAGVAHDARLTIALEKPTAESYLRALIVGLRPTQGSVAYDIRGGMLRVSTQARLDHEHAAATGGIEGVVKKD